MLGPRRRRSPTGLGQLRREMDSLLRSALGRSTAGRRGSSPGRVAPPTDYYETDGAHVVRVDLPGFERDQLEVEVEDGVLLVRASRSATREGRDYHHKERPVGKFERALPLPDGADVENIEARLADGVLEVRIPTGSRESGRRIDVDAS